MCPLLHPIEKTTDLPERMNNPFDYEPHPLCLEAARRVCDHLAQQTDWAEEVASGKMFGVLVCQDTQGQVGFLAAYSGQILGRADWPWFVPAVFDYLQPDGYFKQEEARISAVNRRIASLESTSDYVSAKADLVRLTSEAEAEIDANKTTMHQAKVRRDELRKNALITHHLSPITQLERESQFQKAELRRLKKRWADVVAEAKERLEPMESEISALKQERKHRSDALQRWLFDQFGMLNERGERRTLTEIFRNTPQGVPPSGSGECCAPKLLQYAYLHHLQPLAIAEFWQGRSPRMEIRHHGQFYPACRGKCKPILGWMLGQKTESDGPDASVSHLRIVHQDEHILVVEKPAGLLSVPGRTDAPSVESLLRQQFPEIHMVHRLDMDTSGLMVVALTEEAYHHLQRQFLARTINKKYIALLDGKVSGSGTIRLPLRPDPLDRPRQVVDPEHGKPAVTDYRVLEQHGGQTLVELTPHTGRTHQLRVHCAHADGLGCPIVGDRLYGKTAQRLYLHAAGLSFTHPVTGERLTFFTSDRVWSLPEQ
ncbi:MAG: RluA family pseudouridine synthase [Prevotella sp.]|nr:RluA family pseudouridine synthase [Prevotella sp.]